MSNAYDMAFPVLDRSQTPNDTTQLGLTKREYFAAIAPHGIFDSYDGWTAESAAAMAVEYADALIAALNKPVQP